MAANLCVLLVKVGFIMVIITKERVNEIGVLKPLASPNSKIVTQFLSESIFMASGFAVCILITFLPVQFKQPSLNQVQMCIHQQKKNQRHNQFQCQVVSPILNPTPVLFYGFNPNQTTVGFSVDGKSLLTSFGLTILIGIIGALLVPYWGALRMQQRKH